MVDGRFDRLARAFAANVPRRGGLRLLAGAAVAALGLAESAAKPKPKSKAKPKAKPKPKRRQGDHASGDHEPGNHQPSKSDAKAKPGRAPRDERGTQEADARNQTPDERRAARQAAGQPTEEGTPTTEEPATVTCAHFETAADAQAAFDADPEGLAALDADGNGIACEELLEPEATAEPDVKTQARKKRRAPRDERATVTAQVAGASLPVLLARYGINLPNAGVDWSKVAYRPRQFANGLVVPDPTRGPLKIDTAGAYAGWDFFPAYNWSNHRAATAADWVELQLNRAATLAVVWRGQLPDGHPAPAPQWLASWTKGPDVGAGGKQFPTYRKRVAAGRVILGAVYDPAAPPSGRDLTRDTYWVLLAEDNDTPSSQPPVPAGREQPHPNETCPAWIHDQYMTTGPDGKTYPTWHHQIDPIYWCYHRHEHGSDPQHFAPNHVPLFGYVAAADGMDEVHQGFKTYVFDDGRGNRWMVTHHFGTAGLARACNRFHTVGIAVRRASDNLLLADLHLMADFGRAVVNATQAYLTPPTCPKQAAEALAAGSTGIRQLPVQTGGPVFYEPWRFDAFDAFDARENALGLTGTLTFNTPDGIVICNTAVCDQPVTTGKSGSARFLTPNGGFGLVAGVNTGTFYTDAQGKRRLAAGTAGAVQQYVRPGVSLALTPGGSNGHYFDLKAWGQPFVFGTPTNIPTNREGSIGAKN
jgi:hypothetical protein